MPKRKRLKTRTRSGTSSRTGRKPGDPRSAARELREARTAQAETSAQLKNATVPIAIEPAFAFKP
jgi:hypothetical protein